MADEQAFERMPSTDELLDMIPEDDASSVVEAPEASGETSEPEHVESGPPADATPAEDDASQPRDELGRFAEKPKDEGVPTEAAPGEETPATPPTPTPEAEAPGPESEEFPEYSYRAYGQEYSLPGSKVGSDGIFIPTAGVNDLGRMLARAQSASRRETQLQQELAQAQSASAAELAEAKAIVEDFGRLREMYRTEGEEAILEWFGNLDRNWDLIQARAENQRLQRELEQGKGQLSEVQTREAAEELSGQIQEHLRGAVSEALKDERLAHLDADQLYRRLASNSLDRLYTEDEGGQIQFNADPLFEELEYALSLAPTPAPKAKVEAVVNKNKAATVETPKVPAVAPAGGGEAPSATPGAPDFKGDKEAAERWLDNEGWR